MTIGLTDETQISQIRRADMKESIASCAIFGLLIILTIVLIRILISKIKNENSFAEPSEKMTAIVRSVAQEHSLSKTPRYIFTVDAINGHSYILSGSGIKVSRIKVGDVFEIYVPEGSEFTDEDAYSKSIKYVPKSFKLTNEGAIFELFRYVPEGSEFTEEDAYFESILSGGEEAIKSLSDREMERLIEYVSKKAESLYVWARIIDDSEVSSPSSDGRELRKEVIADGIIILVVVVFILGFGYQIVTGR